MRFPKMSSTTKKLATGLAKGGVLAGAIVGLESGMSWFVAGYPDFLKGQMSPLPRNGALLADLGPAGAALYLKKKKKHDNLANGMLFYDLPKLLDQIVYNVAYNAGRPQVGLALRSQPFRLNIRPANNVAARVAPASGGRYTVQNTSVNAAMGGSGRYR